MNVTQLPTPHGEQGPYARHRPCVSCNTPNPAWGTVTCEVGGPEEAKAILPTPHGEQGRLVLLEIGFTTFISLPLMGNGDAVRRFSL